MALYYTSLFLMVLVAILSMSDGAVRQKRLFSTCGLPCFRENNKCLNGGTCNSKHICDCSGLSQCSGTPCATPGNQCVGSLGTCTRCSNGNYCKN